MHVMRLVGTRSWGTLACFLACVHQFHVHTKRMCIFLDLCDSSCKQASDLYLNGIVGSRGLAY